MMGVKSVFPFLTFEPLKTIVLLTEVVKKELQQRESQNEWQSFSMQNKSSHTKKGAINIADTVFLLQNPSTTDKIDTKYRLVATIAQYGIYTRMLLVLISQITGWLLYLYIGHNIYKFASLQYREK